MDITTLANEMANSVEFVLNYSLEPLGVIAVKFPKVVAELHHGEVLEEHVRILVVDPVEIIYLSMCGHKGEDPIALGGGEVDDLIAYRDLMIKEIERLEK